MSPQYVMTPQELQKACDEARKKVVFKTKLATDDPQYTGWRFCAALSWKEAAEKLSVSTHEVHRATHDDLRIIAVRALDL